MLSSISERVGLTKKDLITEIDKRQSIIHWMREHNIRSYRDVAAMFAEYYARPKQFYEKILTAQEVKPIAVSGNT